MTPGQLDTANLTDAQRLAIKYFAVAIILFGAQLLFGMLAGLQFLRPEFLYGVLDFNVNRMVHINAMIVWMLFGFVGSIYWLLEDESGAETPQQIGLVMKVLMPKIKGRADGKLANRLISEILAK